MMLKYQGKCITNYDYNKFASDIHNAKIKQEELVNTANISNLVKHFWLKHKTYNIGNKAELKSEQDKIPKLQVFDSSFFHVKIFFSDHVCQNIFVYQPKFDTLELKKTRVMNMLFVGNQKGNIILNMHH